MKIIVNEAIIDNVQMITHINDYSWNMRDNQEIIMEKSYEEIKILFYDGTEWGYILDGSEEIIDCSEYSVLGDVKIHANGTVSVRMGKPTAIEVELADAKAALALLGVTDYDNA